MFRDGWVLEGKRGRIELGEVGDDDDDEDEAELFPVKTILGFGLTKWVMLRKLDRLWV